MNKEEKIQEFQKIIDQAKHIVFFTGAGVSTLSGIPDFRSQDGLYNQKYAYPPEEIISHHHFEENPEEFFRFYKDKMLHLDAKPNIVHTFIAECEKKGKSLGNVIKLSTDDHWQSLQKTLKPGMEQSFNQIVIPGLFFCGLFEQFQT